MAMSTASANDDEDVPSSPEWRGLVAEFGRIRLGQDEAIYALPLTLIEAIQTHAPAVFSEKDVAFERAFRQAAGTGFRRRQPFGCSIVEANQKQEVPNASFGDVRLDVMRETRLDLHTLPWSGPSIASQRSEDGRNAVRRQQKETADQLRAVQRVVETNTMTHLCGYAGWLLTKRKFHADRDRFRKSWRRPLHLRSVYPTREVAQTLTRQAPPRTTGDQLTALSHLGRDAISFFDKWGLDGMLTWDLPRFTLPQQLTCDAITVAPPSKAGISLFLPWSLLGSRELNLAAVIQYHQLRQDLSHLSEWLYDSRKEQRIKKRSKKSSSAMSKNDGLGVVQYGNMLPLYVYTHLVLHRRYEQQIHRQTLKLDRAFAEYLSGIVITDEELPGQAEKIRKLRECMAKRLHSRT